MNVFYTYSISDQKKRTFLQRMIKKRNLTKQLKNYLHCGNTAFRMPGCEETVFLLSNPASEKVSTFGTRTCHSPWGCPKCTPIVMAKKGSDIACLIDALATWHNQVAIMITYTVPHYNTMSCKEAFDLLRHVWRKFTNKRTGKNYTKSNGEKIHYQFNSYGTFKQKIQSNYNVKVVEFTWGINGWHPHLHQLLFLPKENLHMIKEHLLYLKEQWYNNFMEYYEKYLPQDLLILKNHDIEEFGRNNSCYLSIDSEGNPVIQKSSWYISGWSGDKELTRLHLKTAHSDHFTPNQIFNKAYETKDTKDSEKWIQLYLEYLQTTKCHRRVEFSKKQGYSCKQLILKWKLSEEYRVKYLKKNTDSISESLEWTVAYWFSKKQWRQIITTRDFFDEEIICKLMEAALLSEEKRRRESIENILKKWNIPLTTKKHHREDYVLSIYNRTLYQKDVEEFQKQSFEEHNEESTHQEIIELGDEWVEYEETIA